jgi:DNA-binding winged helix-turn-helix (wHTH) protein
MRIHFGEFVLDRDTRQLVRGDLELHLGAKAFDFLDFLIAQTPRVVSRARIRDRLWPGTFISESTLATVVNEVRAALGDDPKQPRFIRTVRGHGYAFHGEVSAAVPGAPPSPHPGVSFHLVLEDREATLREGENLLGRVENGVLWLDAPTVSRRHARVVVAGGEAFLEDLGSKNGTFLKGKKLSAPVALSDGDVIWLGQVAVTFRVLSAGGPTRTAR